MLKADMHMHCNDDPIDTFIEYSAEDLIKEASNKGFDVIAITLHKEVYSRRKYQRIAKKHKVLLIPGVELNIEGRDVLAYNVTKKDVKKVKKLEDLEKIRKKNNLIVAPHPYLPFANSLGRKLDKHHELFDAVEHTFFYQPWLKFWNRRVRNKAEKYGLPLVGNSDCHSLWQLGYNYTSIDSKKTKTSVIKAIKEGRVHMISAPIPFRKFMGIAIKGMMGKVIKSKKSSFD